MRIRVFGLLFVVAFLATVAVFVGESPGGAFRDIRSHLLVWFALVLALGIPLAMGIFWAMKPQHNPWIRRSLEPTSKPTNAGNPPHKPGGAGR